MVAENGQNSEDSKETSDPKYVVPEKSQNSTTFTRVTHNFSQKMGSWQKKVKKRTISIFVVDKGSHKICRSTGVSGGQASENHKWQSILYVKRTATHAY